MCKMPRADARITRPDAGLDSVVKCICTYIVYPAYHSLLTTLNVLTLYIIKVKYIIRTMHCKHYIFIYLHEMFQLSSSMYSIYYIKHMHALLKIT